jgi:serine O-acetyltransferase
MIMYDPKTQPDLRFTTDWNIGKVVADLRTLRDASLAARQRVGKPVKLPLRKAIVNVVEGLAAVLFPNRLGSREVAEGSVDYFVGRVLDVTLRELLEQVLRELQFVSGHEGHGDDLHRQATAIVSEFANTLPGIRAVLETDIEATYEGDDAARSLDEVLACYPGITALIHYRIAHELHRLGAPIVARIIAEIAHSNTGIDIHPAAQIGGSLFIDHGTGIVIGETAVIGQRVHLSHGVTLGSQRPIADEHSTTIAPTRRHPLVEDDVVIFAGATILGPVTIGRNSVIGGNVCLTSSVPPGSNVAWADARRDAC